MSNFSPISLEIILRNNIKNITFNSEENTNILNSLQIFDENFSPPISYPNPLIVERTTGQSLVYYYDMIRFSPHDLRSNYSNCVQLLKELRILSKEIKMFGRTSQELIQQRINFEKKKLLNEKIKELLKKDNNSIIKSSKLKFIAYGRSPRAYKTSIIEDEERLQIELSINEETLKIEEETLKRKEELFKDSNSNYSNYYENERAKAAFIHKSSELTMLVEAIKHGLNVLFDINPEQLSIKSTFVPQLRETATIEEKTKWYLKNSVNSNEILISIEKYIWKVAKILQAKFNNSQVTVEYFKIAPPTINIDKQIKFKYSPFSGSNKKAFLKGISVEFITKTGLIFKTDANITRPYVEPTMTVKTFQNVDYKEEVSSDKIRISVIPPFQKNFIQEQQISEYELSKQITFYSQVNRRDISSLRKDGSDNTFYGTNILKNLNPEGDWIISLSELPSEDFQDRLDQVAVYFHLTLI